MKKLLKEFQALGWSVIGAGFVIITLSGDIKQTAVLLTVAGILIQLSTLLIPKDKDDNQD
jgi:hypothetical protein